jgi:hypothetical protein
MSEETLNSFIFTGITLLILSQVAEKITTFIRTYIRVLRIQIAEGNVGKSRQRVWAYVFRPLLILDNGWDLARGQLDNVSKSEEPRVEFAITKLSLLVCFLIALLFRADIFELFDSHGQPHEVLGKRLVFEYPVTWGGAWIFVRTIFGCLCTGFLLTFGSKFFHDLLEILFEVKRFRRKLADEYVYRSPDLGELDRRLLAGVEDPVRLVLEQHRDRLLRTFPNIVSVARIFKNDGFSYLEIKLRDADSQAIQQYDFSYLVRGGAARLEARFILIVENVEPVEAQHLGAPLGTEIRNKRNREQFGTLGFYARRRADDRVVFVTCYHVVKTEKHRWEDFTTARPEFNEIIAPDDDSRQAIGAIISSEFSELMDAAAIELAPNLEPNFKNIAGHFIRRPHAIQPEEISNTQKPVQVWLYGATTREGHGIVYALENGVQVKFTQEDGTVTWRQMNDLLFVRKFGSELNAPGAGLSEGGDSGALLIDSRVRAVGMIIGGNERFSIAIPITRILERLKLDWMPPLGTFPT